eukprot:CAMPEP_0172410118 /NCGR_PEP_ID=MMETSP1061-20121228/76714_1 /TAXON_ID=37318 /ORGANISM="Pseudo-nitzschia pungens, Strain cf. pungens" /LENGTH=412 /DNA_ID=CAMNT_0013146289 /DNA_START=1037 /DNA_END=2272 /DNA_ORIENTATION=-
MNDNANNYRDDSFPSFDGSVTYILRDVFNIESESDPICSALIQNNCQTWTAFQCITKTFVSSLWYRDGHCFTPLSPVHVFRLHIFIDYMDYVATNHGPGSFSDPANYNRVEFLRLRRQQRHTIRVRPRGPFPSFDYHVTRILRDFLHIASESDPICAALITADCHRWIEFRFLCDALISCLTYHDCASQQDIPLCSDSVLKLRKLVTYMAYLNATHGAGTSFDPTKYDLDEFRTLCYTYDLDEFRHLCQQRCTLSVTVQTPAAPPVPPTRASPTRALTTQATVSPPPRDTAAAPSPPPTVPSFVTTCPPAAPTASHTRAPMASPTRAPTASPPRAFAALAAASPPRAFAAQADASRTTTLATIPVTSPPCTPTALTHVPVHLSCPPALSFLPGAFSAVDSFGSLTRRHRDAI